MEVQGQFAGIDSMGSRHGIQIIRFGSGLLLYFLSILTSPSVA